MVTDPVADVITRIRNAGLAGHKTVIIPVTKFSFEILRILTSHKYVDSFVQYEYTPADLTTANKSQRRWYPQPEVAEKLCTSLARPPIPKLVRSTFPSTAQQRLVARDPGLPYEGFATSAYPLDGINSSRCIAPPFIESDSLNGAFLVFLSYVQKKNCKKQPKIETLKRISTSSRRVYWKFENMPRIQNGFGFAILTTPFGLITDHEARQKRIGGEVLLSATRRF